MTNDNVTSPIIQFAQPLIDFGVSIVNQQRLGNPQPLEYIQFTIGGGLPALPEPRNIIQERILGRAPLSLLEMGRRLRQIADDPRTKGVILHLRDLAMPLADLQTLRDSLLRFRSKGKKLIVFSQHYTMATYYIASTADEILLQPGGSVATTGLVQQQTFLREALDTVGLQADSVAISPYKSAVDTLTRTAPSPEEAAMTNWLLDSRFNMLLEDMAAGRKKSIDELRAMIDGAPYTDKEALSAGYVDAIVTEEGLYAHLTTRSIHLWEEAEGRLTLRAPNLSDRYIAVLRVSGLIVQGESANPPIDIPIPLVGGERMGDLTVVRQIRNLMHDDRAAALVLFIDSGGGSAAASEAIASALEELAKTRPVVAYMNNVAASGGSYIATPADWIVAQPGTITGSIGVFSLKLVNSEALRKLRFNPHTYLRGENAGIFAPIEPFTPDQRTKMRTQIERIYEQFVERVAAARKMKVEQVDAVAQGRVWTGKQAHDHKLVDELGGLYEAVRKARELAKLDEDAPIMLWHGGGKPMAAQLAEHLNPAASLQYWQENLSHITNGAAMMMMPSEWKF
jgi:protease-4